MVLAAVGAVAMAAESPVNDAVLSVELASLRSAQDTVKQAQFDLDGIDQNSADRAAMGAAAAVKEKQQESQEHPDLGEALMKEDDANPMPGLDNDAAVQVEAAQNAVKQEDETEGEEAANPKDVEKVLDLANSMKKTDLLPAGWEEKFDASSGKNYYENMHSKTTTWDPPRSLVGIALTAAQGQLSLRRQVQALKRKLKLKMESGDLGESADVNEEDEVKTKCPKEAARLLDTAKKLHSTVGSLAEKLNLTGEQQQILKKLMATTPVPQIDDAVLAAAKPKPKVTKASKKAAQAAKTTIKKIAAGDEHNDLGESADTDEPVELGEAAALEATADAKESAAVQAAMRAESTRVAKQFADDEQEKQEIAKKAAIEAGNAIDDKMAKEDAALFDSDKEDDASMQNIVGDQKQLEMEQAMFRGHMTPDQLNQVVDPDIAEMEKDDLQGDDVDFKPVELKDDEEEPEPMKK